MAYHGTSVFERRRVQASPRRCRTDALHAAWKRPFLALVVAAAVLLSWAPAIAQQQAAAERQPDGTPFSETFGDYTLIYSATPADTLPEEAARRHGIAADSNTVLLNVTVQRDGANLPARIDARAVNLAGQAREIDMQETVANDLVSYTGTVEIADREVLDFDLEVLPEGAAEPFGLEFRQAFTPLPRGGAETESGVPR